jgi:hypothetical protein
MRYNAVVSLRLYALHYWSCLGLLFYAMRLGCNTGGAYPSGASLCYGLLDLLWTTVKCYTIRLLCVTGIAIRCHAFRCVALFGFAMAYCLSIPIQP